MKRSLIVIFLAIVCGVSAALGVRQFTPPETEAEIQTTKVFLATRRIRRGAKITERDIHTVDWPTQLIPLGIVSNKDDIINRSALTSINPNQPFFVDNLSNLKGSGFASNTIKRGMRACTIPTTSVSSSVAGFVRPGDHVDVLLNLRGQPSDETGGGSSLTLIQSAEVFAIDDIMDVDNQSIEMWLKEGVKSVTVLVTPEQALQIALGQSQGTLSLALRNGDDVLATREPIVTLTDIRRHRAPPAIATSGEADPGDTPVPAPSPEVPLPGVIRTMRGTQIGEVPVVMAEVR